ncbi:hypothetical protein [Acinetobacter indicus]|uniref:hypothetical protein n=1 Tax=Acinetobacter indicus TaxID=756892 RepID=UPI002090E7B5|nr:hypothetical protein [Acinetobacter indicus]
MKIFPFLALALGVGAISSTKASTALQAYQASFVLSSYAKTKYPIVFAHGFGSLLGHSMNVLTQNQYPVEITAALDAMHPEKIQRFNALYGSSAIPKDCNSQGTKITSNGIHHYSWMGNRQVTNAVDVIESTVVTLGGSFLKGSPNDGALPLCSGRYGQIIRQDYQHNHFDEVNQFFGIIGTFAQDAVALYRQHANRLKLQGL